MVEYSFVFLETNIRFKNELDKDRNTSYIHWIQKTTQEFWKTNNFDTNKIVTPRPERVDTWQSPRALVWVLVFQNPTKGPQGIWYPSSFEKREPNPTYQDI